MGSDQPMVVREKWFVDVGRITDTWVIPPESAQGAIPKAVVADGEE